MGPRRLSLAGIEYDVTSRASDLRTRVPRTERTPSSLRTPPSLCRKAPQRALVSLRAKEDRSPHGIPKRVGSCELRTLGGRGEGRPVRSPSAASRKKRRPGRGWRKGRRHRAIAHHRGKRRCLRVANSTRTESAASTAAGFVAPIGAPGVQRDSVGLRPTIRRRHPGRVRVRVIPSHTRDSSHVQPPNSEKTRNPGRRVLLMAGGLSDHLDFPALT